jgi:PAS domain S-box-containing protein
VSKRLSENKSNPECAKGFQIPFEEIFEAMPGYVLILDNDYKILKCNRRFRKDFGKPRGKLCYKMLRNQDSPCSDCHARRCISSDEQIRTETTLERPNGEQFHGIVHMLPLKDKNGKVSAVLEMITDVTPIVSLKNQLAESEKRYHLLFDDVPCYISVQNRDLKIVNANRRFREDFGNPDRGHCYEVYKHRDEPCLVCPVLSSFHDGKEHINEEVVTNLKGERRYVLVHSAPLRNESGEIEYVVEMSSDITEVRELQSQLQSLGMLVGSVSHGIKSMLTGLDGGVYMIDTGLKNDKEERVSKGQAMVERNVVRIRSMVLDLLYFAKDREPEWQLLEAGKVVQDACRMLEPKFAKSNIKVQVDLHSKAGFIEGDPKALHIMMVNIIENSIDACKSDRKKSEHWIDISVTPFREYILFEVSDNGIGMDQETRDRLFSLFFSSKGTEGTGLGLFIADKIIKKHGGSIEAESESGIGSRFYIRIPKKRLNSQE